MIDGPWKVRKVKGTLPWRQVMGARQRIKGILVATECVTVTQLIFAKVVCFSLLS